MVVGSGKRLERKVSVEIPDAVFRRVEEIARKYGFRTEEAIKILLMGDFLRDTENVTDVKLRELEEKMDDLERKLYELEGKWSPLKFRTYYLAMDNQNLSIQLSAMIAQNRRLREKLGLPGRDYGEIVKKIRYYLNFGRIGDGG
ncbi:hypothetical protein [Thermococcus sp. M36]|uniref:hypothetical protein n=1 Tax=Thermococcus sp. M36 TaxID=1638261 RepID=UPI0031836459